MSSWSPTMNQGCLVAWEAVNRLSGSTTSIFLMRSWRSRCHLVPVLRVEGVVRGLDLAVQDGVIIIMKWGITTEQDVR